MVENEPTQTETETAAPAAEAPATAQVEEKTLTDIQIEGFAKALKNDPAEAYARYGLGLFHSLSDEEAQAQLAGLKIQPEDSLAFYNQGVVLAGQDKFADAARAFARAGELDPTLSEAIYNQALATEKAGDAAEARKLWNRYLEFCDDPDETAEIKNHITELANR